MLPQTPWEQGGTWATPGEEAAFLSELESAASSVTVDVIGHSWYQSHPIHTVTITEAGPDAPVVLIVGGQHGYEPMGREAVLHLARDVIGDDLLGQVRFVCVPTVSPGGAVTFTRNTPSPVGAVDMNRDHLEMRATETRALQQLITDLEPAVLIDCHEYELVGTASTEVWTKASDHVQGDAAVNIAAQSMNTAIRATLTSKGIPNGPYTPSSNPTVLSNQATLRHCVTMLVETPRVRPEAERATMYHELFAALLDWLRTNLSAAVSASQGARVRKSEEGALRSSPFDLLTEIMDPPPEGYADLAEWPTSLTTLGVEGTTEFVSMGQPAQPLIPYLLDGAGGYAVVSAARVADPLPAPPGKPEYIHGGTPTRMRVNYGGVMVDVGAVRLGTPDGTVTIWQR